MEELTESIDPVTNEAAQELPVHVIPEIQIKENFFDFTTTNEEFINLKLTELGIIVEDKENDKQKNISYQSLLNALSEEASLNTGILPILGDNYVAIKQYIVVKDKHILIVESSPRQRKIKYNRTGEQKDHREFVVPFPGLLMCITLKRENDNDFKIIKDASRIYALKTPVYNDQTTVYKYPYTNVYDDNRICWGNSLNFLKDNLISVNAVAGLLETFLSADNNEDLYSSSKAPHKGDSAQNMFEAMNKVSDYPYETLVKHLTYKEIVSLLINN